MSDSFLSCASSEDIINRLYPEGVAKLIQEDDKYGYGIAVLLIPKLVHLRDFAGTRLTIENMITAASPSNMIKLLVCNELSQESKSELAVYVGLLNEHNLVLHDKGLYSLYNRSIRYLNHISDVSICMVKNQYSKNLNIHVSELERAIQLFKTSIVDNNGMIKFNVDTANSKYEELFNIALTDSSMYQKDMKKYTLNILRLFLRTSMQKKALAVHKQFISGATSPQYEPNIDDLQLIWEIQPSNLVFKNEITKKSYIGQLSTCSVCGFDTKDSIGDDDRCILCYEAAHTVSSKGYMIWLPELTQVEVNWLSRWASTISVYRGANGVALDAEFTFFMNFINHRKEIAESLFGSSSAKILYDAGWRSQNAIQGLRYFSFVGDEICDWDYPNRFNKAVVPWTDTMSKLVSATNLVIPYLES